MEKLFNRLANATARLTGKPLTFALCFLVILVWAVTGPIFGFSQTWQLVINTGTTIVTFLMVFLIQNTQNRDAAAMQAKLDELVYANRNARNRFIGIEHLTVPMGFVQGLPVGLSIFGARWDDARILSLGYAYEQQSRAFRAPGFLNSVNDNEEIAPLLRPVASQ